LDGVLRGFTEIVSVDPLVIVVEEDLDVGRFVDLIFQTELFVYRDINCAKCNFVALIL
jgi:hypothetical protein